MFCHKCGYKITNGNQCRHCGEIAGEREMCGGFWGLVGEKNQVIPQNNNGEKTNVKGRTERVDNNIFSEQINKLATEQRKIQKQQKKTQYILYAVIAFGVILTVISNILFVSRLDKLNNDNQMIMFGLKEDLMSIESIVDNIQKKTSTEKPTVKETVTQEVTTKETVEEKETTKESVTQEATTKETVEEKETTKESVTQEVTTKETVEEKETTKETVSQEANTKEKDTSDIKTETSSTSAID